MKALRWYDSRDVRMEDAPDPRISDPKDAILRVTSTSICGSDLHLYDGFVATLEKGDILGHEFMGEVMEVGAAVKSVRPGDRVVVAFPVSCGECVYCQKGQFSLCHNSNPNKDLQHKFLGNHTAAIYGYSHMFGGLPGGQAQFVRVPYADIGMLKVPSALPDEKVLFLSDIFPTGYNAAENCDLKGGETVAVWGCGPVGQFSIRSAFLLGAERVIAIDHVPERLEMAKKAGAITLNFDEVKVHDQLMEMTRGHGPDACIDAVGMEAHEGGFIGMYDKIKQVARLQTDRPFVLRQAIMACRKGGVVSVMGAYGGFGDKIPLGAMFNKALTIRQCQAHVQKYWHKLLDMVESGAIDPSFVVSHRMPLSETVEGYKMFLEKRDGCTKIVLKP
ncbi:MAG: Alcohol dehydrogenase GroES domain protein [Fibrobacteres bacterium]|nr:Alcohol dehydrogenase GroES domain protein [Fibrobacterota bacterium]